MISDDELGEIQARADAATPGPWVVLGNSVAQQVDHCTCAGHIPCYGHEQYCGLEGPVILEAHQTDATFAAHARTDVPRLVAEIRRLRGEWWELVEALHEIDADIPLNPEPSDITNYLAFAVSDSWQHAECPSWCSLCGEQMADQTCPECRGYGELPGDVRIECEACRGDGRVHDCPEVSYAELVRVYRETQQEES